MCNRLVSIFSLKFSPAYINCRIRITKMRENCLQQFDAHWECLEKRNQVCDIYLSLNLTAFYIKEISHVVHFRPRLTVELVGT
jgi:hypothetical protein